MTDQLTLTARNAGIEDIVGILRGQQAAKYDVTAPISTLRAEGGSLVIAGTDPLLTDDGVTMVDGTYRPTATCDNGLATRLAIPPGYLRRCREQNVDLWDRNVEGWLRHPSNEGKKYLVRTFRGGDGPGIARAFLSDSYMAIDHLDALMACLEGIGRAGVEVQVESANLGDEKMHVTLWSPQVVALAPKLLEHYRSPFEGSNALQRAGDWDMRRALAAADREGLGYEGDEPVIFGGFLLSNSEVGIGRYTLTPRLRIRACKNGLTLTEELFGRQHLGVRLEEGAVDWSRTTQAKALELISSQTADVAARCLDQDWVIGKVRELEGLAATPVKDGAETVKVVSKQLRYSEERQAEILRAFVLGGQQTAGGVANAITAVAQTILDSDDAFAFEADAIKAMRVAASVA